MFNKLITLLLISIFILSGCAPKPPTSEANSTNTAAAVAPHSTELPGTTEVLGNTTTPLVSTETPFLTPTPVYTPTPDLRPLPKDWQNWPVIPTLSARAIEIYNKGISLGNNPNAFSKVGDCQSISEVLLGIYDNPNYFAMFDKEPELQETITQFQGSYNRDGMAVEGGFNTAAVLSPIWANPNYCQAGETPLECEYRIQRPSIAIISLEVWWDGRTPDRYETYMRRIIEYFIERGTLPILSTKADNVEGDHSINYTTARLAYEYDIPLWNFWLAVQPLPNHGMDATRNDGFHIAPDTWSTRSYTALQVLSSAWHEATKSEQAAAPLGPTRTPLSIVTTQFNFPSIDFADLLTPSSRVFNNPGRIIFGLSERQSGITAQRGIFILDISSGQVYQLRQDGFNIQDVSTDGQTLLINNGSSLYVQPIDGTPAKLITDDFYAAGKTGAAFTPDDKSIVFISGVAPNTKLNIQEINSTTAAMINTQPAVPVELFLVPDSNHIFWQAGTCSPDGTCIPEKSYTTTINNQESINQAGINRPVSSPDGQAIAYTKIISEDLNIISFTDLSQSFDHPVFLTPNHIMDYSWSPDSVSLSVIAAIRSDYSGKISKVQHLVINRSDYKTILLSESLGLNSQAIWSPDSRVLISFSTNLSQQNEDSSSQLINIQLIDTTTKNQTDLSEKASLQSEYFLAVTNLFWLPQ